MLFLIAVIIGGAIGNLIDRLFRADDGFLSGGVVDFIDLQWWPVFNIADMAVVGGAIGLMILTMLMPDPSLDADDAPADEQVDGEVEAGPEVDTDDDAESTSALHDVD